MDAQKSENRVNIMKFAFCTYKSDMFVQGQQNFARTHVRVSVTFGNPTPPSGFYVIPAAQRNKG